jgi:hypothetical protein
MKDVTAWTWQEKAGMVAGGVVLLLCFLALVGCTSYHTEHSETMTEGATILDIAYSPEQHGHTSGGVGVTTSGKAVVTFGEDVNIPESCAIVFRCDKHGKFVIDPRNSSRAWDLFKQYEEGDKVLLSYREEYEVAEKDGVEVARVFQGYDLLSVTPLTETRP